MAVLESQSIMGWDIFQYKVLTLDEMRVVRPSHKWRVYTLAEMNVKQFHQEKENSLVDICNEGVVQGNKKGKLWSFWYQV